MKLLLLAAILACRPGDRLVDISHSVDAREADLVVAVEPFYTRVVVYPAGHPELAQRCCNGKPASVIHIRIPDRQFCVGQSQPQMKWTVHVDSRPGIGL